MFADVLLVISLGCQLFGPVLTMNYPPSDVQITSNKDKLAVGETLMINCSLKTGGNASLEIHHNGHALTEFVTFSDETSVQIVIPNITLKQDGSYHCYKDPTLLPSTRNILVGYPPVKPRKIKCVSENLENLTCTWNPVKTSTELNIVTTWTLCYQMSVTKDNSPEHETACSKPQKTMTYFWPQLSSKEGEERFIPGMFYLIWVTADNLLGTATSERSRVPTTDIVKLSPAYDVSAHPISSTSVSLNWTTRSILHIDLIYNITFTCSDCVHCERWQVGNIIEGTFRRLKFMRLAVEAMVNGLEPFTKYKFSVKVKTKRGGYWSEASQPFYFKTWEDVPLSSPVISNSSFTLFRSSPRGRQLYLYWRPPEKKFRNGVITEYQVEITPPITESGLVNVTGTQPMLPSLLLNDSLAYQIRLAAVTKKGHGPFSSVVVIPPQNQVLPMITMVAAEVNNSHAIINWQPPVLNTEVITTFSVHYCEGEITQPGKHTARCKDDYNWREISADRTSASLTIPNEQSYVFGVSMETDKGSSSIVWSPCVFKLQGRPGKVQKLRPEVIDNTWVTLSWAPMSCVSARVRVLYYEVNVCEFAGQYTCSCDQGSLIDYPGVWDRHTAHVDDLKSGVQYNLCVRAVGKDGPGSWSDVLALTTTTPVQWATIVGGCVGGIILIVIIIIGLCIWHYLRTADLEIKIVIPKDVEPCDYIYDIKTGKESITRGDNHYELPHAEEEPLMTDVRGGSEWTGKLQHLPVSQDSGTDSLSEENGHESFNTKDDATTPLTTPSSIRADKITLTPTDIDLEKSENKMTIKAKVHNSPLKLQFKRESGFFDDLSPEDGDPKNINKRNLIAPCAEGIVCHVHSEESNPSSEMINSYSKFEETGPNSGSSVSSYTAFDDTASVPKSGSKKVPWDKACSIQPHTTPVIKPELIAKKLANCQRIENNNNNASCSDGEEANCVELDQLEFDTGTSRESLQEIEKQHGDEDDSPAIERKSESDKQQMSNTVQPTIYSRQVSEPDIVPYVQISVPGYPESQQNSALQFVNPVPEYVRATPDSEYVPSVQDQVRATSDSGMPGATQSGGYVAHPFIPSLAGAACVNTSDQTSDHSSSGDDQ